MAQHATILVVDDEQLIRWSLTERLRSEGYDLAEAATGREALEKARDGVDLVLLDYKLPDLDGGPIQRICARVRRARNHPELQVVPRRQHEGPHAPELRRSSVSDHSTLRAGRSNLTDA